MAGKTKALIVDDSSLMRKAVRKIFEDSNEIEVSGEAENGRQALELIPALSPDVIVLDVNMPGMNGIEVLRKIREKTNNPVIMLSVISDADIIGEALQAGADDYIGKPFGPQELVARVKVQLKQSGK